MFGLRSASAGWETVRRWGSRVLAVAGLAGAGLLAAPTEAPGCGGTPPPFFCAKTYVLAKGAGNPNLAAAAGGVVTIDTLHFVNLIQFGNCPPAFPATVSMTATLDCDPPPDAGPFNFGPFPIEEGFTEIPIDIPVPAGPPRVCQVVVTSTVTFADGMQIAQTADQQVCLLPSSPVGGVDDPILEVELIGDTTACGHPGDEQGFCFLVRNNDDEPFDGEFRVTMKNVADMPEVTTGQNDTSVGAFALSDPGGGDSYPMTMADPDCVDLPAEPHNSAPEALTGSVVLLPGEETEIKIDVRTWQLCANGSCGEAVFEVFGLIDGTALTACAGFAVAADTSKPATFECFDSGRAVTQALPTTDPNGPAASLITKPDPAGNLSIPVNFVLDIEAMQLLINGFQISGGTPDFSGVTMFDGGFIRTVGEFSFILPQGDADDVFTMINEFVVDVPSIPDEVIEIQDLSRVDGAPNDFETFSPFAIACLSLDVPGIEPYLLDVMHQIFAVGVKQGTFEQVAMTNLEVQFEQVAPNRYRVTSTWQPTNPGDVDAPIIGFDVQNDFRGYAKPVPEEEPCIADCNGDGEINILDFICFQANFEADDLETADCNDDGELNILDFICFQTEFEAAIAKGCP